MIFVLFYDFPSSLGLKILYNCFSATKSKTTNSIPNSEVSNEVKTIGKLGAYKKYIIKWLLVKFYKQWRVYLTMSEKSK